MAQALRAVGDAPSERADAKSYTGYFGSLFMGLPLFFLAMFSGQLKKLPRSGGWMIWARKLMGWVLVAMAAHFIRPVLPGLRGTALIALVALAASCTWGGSTKIRPTSGLSPF